jgi:hypothetical protein
MTVLDDATHIFEQLVGNPAVQDDLDRSIARARQAAARARRAKTIEQAARDAQLRARLVESVAAARDAARGLAGGREPARRRRRGSSLLIAGAALAAAAVVAVLYPAVRDELAPSSTSQQP